MLLAVGTIIACLIAFAIGYDNAVGGESALHCTLDHPECSTAVATWGLCVITVGTIVTGFALFALETRRQLTTYPCPSDEQEHAIRHSDVFVVRRYKRTSTTDGPGIYLEDVLPRVRTSRTATTAFVDYVVDIANLGRSALTNLLVEIEFERDFAGDRRLVTAMLPLGAVGDKDTVHVGVHIEASMKPQQLRLTGQAWDRDAPFRFHPERDLQRVRSGSFAPTV